MRTVYLNGEFVPESEAKLSIYDLSVMQAAAAFEMTRSFNGKHFKLHEHVMRLKQSCELLSIGLPKEWDDIYNIILEATRLNDHGPGEEHRLLIVVSPGCAPMYKDLSGVIPHPFIYIADFPLRYTVAGFSKYFTDGVHCVTSPIQQVPDACVPSAAKHRSRLHFHLAQQRAPEGTWPLMTGLDGGHYKSYVEAPGANIVRVADDTLYLHKREALQGISLATVEELARAMGWRVREHEEHVYYGEEQEFWLTGTPFCVLPATSIDGQPIGDGTIGPRYRQLMEKWSELVGVDIQQQIMAWDAPSPIWTPDVQRLVTN